jgi:DNA helicase-2/ATP-dependent DNA helicase PcrA
MLNEVQQKVAEHHDGHILVKAGPGSGKTKTVMERCSSMIAAGIVPGSILVVTFSREAAAEIRRRVEDQDQGHGICMLTIHALGYLILRETLKDRCPKLIDEKTASKRYLEASRHCGIMPTDDGFLEVTLEKARFSKRIKNDVVKEYINILSRNNEMDMGDLVTLPSILLEDKRIREYWQNRWSHVTIDEAHDCTPIEAKLISQLAYKNLCVVFDENQSIYGWRGGAPDVISKVANFKTYQLPITYRCPQNIYDKAWTLIRAHTSQTPLKCKNGGGKLLIGYTDIVTPLGPDTMVLCRTQNDVSTVEKDLSDRGFPINVSGGLFDSYEASVILAYAEAALGKREAWSTVLRNPFQKKDNRLERVAKRATYRKPLELFLDEWRETHFMIDRKSSEKYEAIMSLCNKGTADFVKKLHARRMPNNNVRVMTLHASKGLEADNVILYNVTDRMLPHKNEKDLNSERRLMYVGMTRARHNLMIMTLPGIESRFITESGIVGDSIKGIVNR